MSVFKWDQTGFEERWFHALACLLQRKNQQQDPSLSSPPLPTTEDDNDFSDSESDDEAATITPRRLAGTQGKKKLLEKFLDRLSETMAYEVACGRKADDVCASAFYEKNGIATVYITKNGALSDEDRHFMRKLQIWLHLIAGLGERRDVKVDAMWKTLLEWNAKRLLYYRKQLRCLFESVTFTTNNSSAEIQRVARKLVSVQTFCEGVSVPSPEMAPSRWTECITTCYELRYEPNLDSCITQLCQKSGIKGIRYALRLKRTLAFLGRLRTAYEIFIEFALQFNSAKTIQLQSVEEFEVLQPSQFEKSELSRRIAESGIDLMQIRIKRNRNSFEKKGKILDIVLRDFEEPVKIHAEVKLVLFLSKLEPKKSTTAEKSIYIGCSKKTCFLCSHFLQGMSGFTTRGSHGKVYPRWTIPTTVALTSWGSLRLHTAVSKIGNTMLELLQQLKGKSRKYIAESTVAVTEDSTAVYQRRHRTKLDHERSFNERRQKPEIVTPVFGPRKYTVRALLIPACGGDLRLVDVPIRPALENYDARDSFARDVPDFGEFWEAALNLERESTVPCEINQQSLLCLNGQYRFYYNRSEELEPNKFLQDKIVQGPIPSERKFWHGDVFLLRLTTRLVPRRSSFREEQGKDEMAEDVRDEKGVTVYEDVPKEILQFDLISKVFERFWKIKHLEKGLELDRHIDGAMWQHNINKEIMLARMSPEERAVLDLFNPSFIEVLATVTTAL